MAKNFDIKIRATNGEAAAAAIKQFADAAEAALKRINTANERAGATASSAAKGIADAAKSAQALGSPASARSIASLGETFSDLDSRTKSVRRTLNDARGTFELLGGAAGSAGTQLAALGGTIGNVADVFGTLANLASRNPLLLIATAAALATTAFVTFQNATADTETAQRALSKALEKTNELLLTQQQRAEIALDAARKAAVGLADAAFVPIEKQIANIDEKIKRFEGVLALRERTLAQSRGRPLPDEPSAERVRGELEAERTRVQSELAQLREQRRVLSEEAAFAQRDRLFPGRGATQFQRGGSREDLSEEEARQRLRQDAEERNRITGEAIEREKAAREQARQAAERERAELEKRNAEILALEQRVANEIGKRNTAVDKYIAKLEEEATLSGQTNQEREIGRALYEAQLKLVDELGNRSRDLTDIERERIAIAVKTKEAMEEQRKATERLVQEAQRAVQRSTDRLVDFAGDAIFDRLTGRVTSFWETFKNFGLRTISQVAAEMVFRPIVAPIIGAAVGAVPGIFGIGTANAATAPSAGGGGLLGGGLVGSPFSSLLSTGGSLVSSAFGGSGGLLQGLGSFVGGALGFGASASSAAAAVPIFASAALEAGAATAATAGSLAASAGGAAAALSPLAATGIGAAIAIPALLGLSSIFGKRKPKTVAASYAGLFDPLTGETTTTGTGSTGGGSIEQAADATRQMAEAIQQIARALGLGRLPTLPVGVGTINGRIGFGTGGSERDIIYWGGDPAVAAAAYLRASLRGTPWGGRNIAATSEAAKVFRDTTGDPRTDAEFAAVYAGFDKTRAAADAVATAMDDLAQKFDRYADLARKYGLEVERIEKARGEAIEATVANFLAPLDQRLGGVRGFLASLEVGPSSPLSPQQQLDAARRQFDDLSMRAGRGEEAAQAAIGDAGRAYLDLARGFFATTEPYAEIYGSVVGQIGDLLTNLRNSDPTVRAIIETGERGTAAVTKALGTLLDSVERLREEVRRSNSSPFRVVTA